jgi:hypothetical protein
VRGKFQVDNDWFYKCSFEKLKGQDIYEVKFPASAWEHINDFYDIIFEHGKGAWGWLWDKNEHLVTTGVLKDVNGVCYLHADKETGKC